MAIKVRCGNCSTGFQAKDSLAGRRVKCPKCKEPITIAAAQATTSPTARKSPAVAAAHNPLLDLLDEQDVRSAARGPVCENCGSELQPAAVICIECGFNLETGVQLQTEAYEDDIASGIADASMTDADMLMAKAEKDIEDVPVTSEQQNFGDGADSILIAVVAGIIGVVLICIGLVVIFTMDQIGNYIASSAISFIASMALFAVMGIWITIIAFMQNTGQGIACVCTGFLWCIVFGFMQGKALIVPTIVLVASLVIGAATGTYTNMNGWTPEGIE